MKGMEVMLKVTCAELPSLIGQEIGPSDWTTITQEMVNQYAPTA